MTWEQCFLAIARVSIEIKLKRDLPLEVSSNIVLQVNVKEW